MCIGACTVACSPPFEGNERGAPGGAPLVIGWENPYGVGSAYEPP
jgi:hypothetical protein